MDRRRFFTTTAGLVPGTVLGGWLTRPTVARADPLSVHSQGVLDLSDVFKGGKVKWNTDTVIDGLPIKPFTWAWVGIGIAEGILANIGSAILGALFGGLFGGKSIEQLLKEQLEAFVKAVEVKLKENDLRNYQAKVKAHLDLFEEYHDDPARRRLDDLVHDSASTLREIESLQFLGYRTYMIAAGLRLAVLQEVVKQDDTSGKRRIFDRQRERAIAFHDEIRELILKESDPETHVGRFRDKLLERGGKPEAVDGLFGPVYRSKEFYLLSPILGKKPEELPRIPPPLPFVSTAENPPLAKFVDWTSLRTLLEGENTALGEIAVERWLGKARFAKRAATVGDPALPPPHAVPAPPGPSSRDSRMYHRPPAQ